MTDTFTVTNRRLLDIRDGLNDLMFELVGVNPQTGQPLYKARTFPSATSRQRVTFQYDSLAPAIKSYEDGLKPLAERESEIRAMEEGAEQLAALADLMKDLEAYRLAEVEVPKPRRMLVEADFPKGAKGSDANAGAVLKLHPEFFALTDPDVGTPADEPEE